MSKETYILGKAKALENLVENDLMYRYDPVGLRMRLKMPEPVARHLIDRSMATLVADLAEVDFGLPLSIIDRVRARRGGKL